MSSGLYVFGHDNFCNFVLKIGFICFVICYRITREQASLFHETEPKSTVQLLLILWQWL